MFGLLLIFLVTIGSLYIVWHATDHSGELLFNTAITVNDQVLYLEVRKDFDVHVGGKDFYTYKCWLYDKKPLVPWNVIHTYKTYWLYYFDYHGDIDKVVKEAVGLYKSNLAEQKYIKDKERNFKGWEE